MSKKLRKTVKTRFEPQKTKRKLNLSNKPMNGLLNVIKQFVLFLGRKVIFFPIRAIKSNCSGNLKYTSFRKSMFS